MRQSACLVYSGQIATGGPHYVVSFNKLHVYSHFVHVYMLFDCLQNAS